MLPKGTISNVIDYFVGNPKFAPAMEESLCMFFDIKDTSEVETLQPSKMAMDFFNEWLVFDCELENRRTLLQEFLFLEHTRLSREQKSLYTDLILTQHYSLYRFDAVRLQEGLTMYDVLSEQTYEVSEYRATFDVAVGSYSFMRLARVSGNWNIVSADGWQMPPDMFPKRIIQDWKKRKIIFDPLVVYQQMLKPVELGVV